MPAATGLMRVVIGRADQERLPSTSSRAVFARFVTIGESPNAIAHGK